MKRIILAFCILLSAVTHACAQLHYGLELGIGISELSFSKSVVDTKNRQGFYVGPKIKINTKIGLGADAALRYAQKNAAIEVWGSNGTEVFEKNNMSYIQVPVNARWDISVAKIVGIYVAAGPQWDWYIGNSTWESKDNFIATFKHSSLSMNVSVGVSLIKRLNISVSRNFPLTKQGDFLSATYNEIRQQVENIDLKSRGWQLSLDFYF